MIEFKQVQIGYDVPLISIEELELRKGELYLLIGKNGAGKSTLLKSITGQLNPMSGSITIEGTPLHLMNDRAIAEKIAFVRSTFPAALFLRVEEYIALGRTPHTNALGRLNSVDFSAIDRSIDTLGLRHLVGKFTSELSDGERQMVAIARAIAQETPIIVLDEPTAFLDYTNKKQVVEHLKSIAQSMLKCILLSTHDVHIAVETESPFLAIVHQQIKLYAPPVEKETLIQEVYETY